MQQAQQDVHERWQQYEHLAALIFSRKRRKGHDMIDLSTSYLGLPLQKSPGGLGVAPFQKDRPGPPFGRRGSLGNRAVLLV